MKTTLPENSPIPSEERDSLNAIFDKLSTEQTIWLSGFLSGFANIAANKGAPVAVTSKPAASAAPITVDILYGTESGNCEELASNAVKAIKKAGY